MTDSLDRDAIVIRCHTPACTTAVRHLFTDGYTIDQALRDQNWTYTRDKTWICPGCSAPRVTTSPGGRR